MINLATILSLIAPFVVLGSAGFALRRVLARPASTPVRTPAGAHRAVVARTAAAGEAERGTPARARQVA